MKKIIVLCLFVVSFLADATSKIEFWNTQQRGANLFNSVERSERLQAAKDFGIRLIRLAPNKWLNGRPEKELGDFLIGRPGKFETLPEKDLRLLREILDEAAKLDLKVVLTMLSLPGARWTQHNGGVEERKIWEDFKEQELALSFWKQLATALKGHPALVGYNVRNEPSPELVLPKLTDWYTGDYVAWQEKVRGTPADINLFYKKAVATIRSVDKETPIVLDSGFYATAWGFKVLEPVNDDKVIYSFHMYEPYAYDSQFNKGRYTYPGKIPLGDSENPPVLDWDRKQLNKYFQPVREWQKRNKIASNRILVGEFGVVRTNSNAEFFMKDLIEVLNSHRWHWAIYSFREDTWAAMDYELGTKKPSWKYWQAIEQRKIPGPDVYKPNSFAKLIRKAIRGETLP